MNVAIIGKGNVGGTLGRRWAESGHSVVFGVRDPGQEGDQSVPDAVAGAEVVVFALPYQAMMDVAKGLDFGDRTLVDATNPIAADFSGLAPSASSAAEELADATGSKRVVKAFNTTGYNVMAAPEFHGRKATMLYCGDDAEAKEAVSKLASELGFIPIDAGPLHQARWLEGLAWLWISMASKYGHGRETTFVYEKR